MCPTVPFPLETQPATGQNRPLSSRRGRHNTPTSSSAVGSATEESRAGRRHGEPQAGSVGRPAKVVKYEVSTLGGVGRDGSNHRSVTFATSVRHRHGDAERGLEVQAWSSGWRQNSGSVRLPASMQFTCISARAPGAALGAGTRDGYLGPAGETGPRGQCLALARLRAPSAGAEGRRAGAGEGRAVGRRPPNPDAERGA